MNRTLQALPKLAQLHRDVRPRCCDNTSRQWPSAVHKPCNDELHCLPRPLGLNMYAGKFTAQNLSDLAAYLATPNI